MPHPPRLAAAAVPAHLSDRAARQVRRAVCSANWFDACWSEVAAAGPAALSRPLAHVDRVALHPPGGHRRTLMRRCPRCGHRWYPPQCVGRVADQTACDDCAIAAQTPADAPTGTTSSPSAAAIAEMGRRRVYLIQATLPPEDEASLRQEIAAHLAAPPRRHGRRGRSNISTFFTEKQL